MTIEEKSNYIIIINDNKNRKQNKTNVFNYYLYTFNIIIIIIHVIIFPHVTIYYITVYRSLLSSLLVDEDILLL